MLLSRISSIFSKRKGEISKLIKLDRNLMTGIMEIMKTSNESFSSSQTMRMTIDCARRSINSQFHTLILSFYRSLIIPLFTKSVDNYGSKEETMERFHISFAPVGRWNVPRWKYSSPLKESDSIAEWNVYAESVTVERHESFTC